MNNRKQIFKNNLKILFLQILILLKKLETAFFIPGYLALGVIAVFVIIINPSSYHNYLHLSNKMTKGELTEEEHKWIQKRLDIAKHIGFWFWIILLYILIF